MNENQEAMTREELDQAMRLPMADILKLPPVKRGAVLAELTRQMAELPDQLRAEAVARAENGDIQDYVQASDMAKDLEEAISKLDTVVKGLLSNEEAVAKAKEIADGRIMSILLAIEKAQADFDEKLKIWAERTKALAPFIEAEEQAARARGDLHITYRDVIVAAKKKAIEAGAIEPGPAEETENLLQIPRIRSIAAEAMLYPLDKPNAQLWDLLPKNEDGRIVSAFKTIPVKKKGGKGELKPGVQYAIDFAALEQDSMISKHLSQFDKRVFLAAAALIGSGNAIVSVSQIHYAMGNESDRTPSAEQVQKINDSLTKMGAAHTTLDNTPEIEARQNYKKFFYDGPLLPFERETVYINNTLAESAIHFFREPPLVTFARERGQIMEVPVEVLKSPVNKTEANLKIDDYLLQRIGHMKKQRNPKFYKIDFDTLNKECNRTTRSQRSRTPEKVRQYLDHYKATSWIKGYTMGKDGVIIDP